MNIAIVTINQENAAIASWLAAQDFSGCTLAHWQIEPQPMLRNRCWMRWWNSGSERLRTLFSFLRARLAMNCRPGWPGVYMVQASAR
ncbi:hypothetical protein [Actinoallomurus acanthiterrae]